MGYDTGLSDIYEYDYTSPEGYWQASGTGMFMRYFQAKEDTAVTQVMVHLGTSGSLVEVDIMPDIEKIGSYSFTPRGSVSAYYPGWYTISLNEPVFVHSGKWFGAVVRTAAGIEYDTSYFTADSGYYNGYSWVYDNGGYCIKCRTTKEADLLDSCRAKEYYLEGSNLWNLIRNTNTDQMAVRGNLSSPGPALYGTRFEYIVQSTGYLDSSGMVTQPPCSTPSAVTVPLSVKFTKGNYFFTLSGQVAVVPKTHQLSDWTVRTKPTELKEGWKTRTCYGCGRGETLKIARLSPSLSSVQISRLESAKKAVTVRWKKLSGAKRKKIKKIHIQLSTDKKFKKGIKNVYVSSSRTSKAVKGLKSGKRYYVRIRAYTKSGSTVHISGWSKVKSVKSR